MPLASDAHVKVGDYEFLIDKSVPSHYVHSLTDLVVERGDIIGAPGKHQVKEDELVWGYDDWSGGEGNRIYYPDDPTVYYVGYELNPRIRGQLTVRPNRRHTTVPTNASDHRPSVTVADGAIWIGGGLRVHHSVGNPATWTSYSLADTGLNALSTAYRITAMTGDHEYCFYTAYHSTGTPGRAIMRIKRAGTGSLVISEETGASVQAYAGLAMMNGRLYAWTGRKLFEMDVANSLPLASDKHRKVYDTGADPATTNVFGTDWWADAVATENSLVFWYSNDAQSRVYE